ncbi:MAG: XRE family transcriptional regulator [Verrucomicrobiota bacterium]
MKELITGEDIREYREKHGLTQTEFGEMAGWKKLVVTNIETGRRKISEPEQRFLKLLMRGEMPERAPKIDGKLIFEGLEAEKIATFARREGFSSPEDWVVTKIRAYLAMHGAEPESDDTDSDETNEPLEHEWHTLPCYGVAAGSPISGDEFEAEFKEPYDDNHFALKVFGDSMEPRIANGEVLVMRKPQSLRNPHVKKGETYCFLLNGQRTLKQYNTRPATPYEIEEGKSYESPRGGPPRVKILESLNPSYPEIVLTESDEPQMLGWLDFESQPHPKDARSVEMTNFDRHGQRLFRKRAEKDVQNSPSSTPEQKSKRKQSGQ